MNKDLKPGLSFNLRKPLIRVHKDTLHLLEDPEYILLYINPEKKVVAIIPCDKNSKDVNYAHKISGYNIENNKTFELYSKDLVSNILKLPIKWNQKGTYTISGYYHNNPPMVMFNLEDAVEINNKD